MAQQPISFGEIEDFPEGSVFHTRMEIHNAGLHRQTQAGISGTESEGADAIVLSGGYEDDQDFGNVIIYTGQGGNKGRRQVADQAFKRGNKWIAISRARGLPIRVI